eukprot:COSAG01_NODE_32217_length_584_cov_2.847423_1_plen_88_part_01
MSRCRSGACPCWVGVAALVADLVHACTPTLLGHTKAALLTEMIVCRGGAVDSTDTNSYRRILDPYELRIILDHSTRAMHVDFSARISR